jgi:hypothetical protein
MGSLAPPSALLSHPLPRNPSAFLVRIRLALLLAGALVLGACGQSDDTSTDAAATDTPSATATEGGTAAPSPGASQPEPVSEDLPDGVAATVGDTEVATEALDERLALIREIPQVKEQLQGDGADQVEARLQSQALGQLVLQEVVLQGAAQEDVEVSQEQVDQRRSELAEEAGGEEALAEQLTSAGVPEGQVDKELRASLAFEQVSEKLLEDAGVDPEATAAPTPDPSSTASPSPNPDAQKAQQIQQEWLLELVSSADVVVDEAYGAWDPSTGQVVPA